MQSENIFNMYSTPSPLLHVTFFFVDIGASLAIRIFLVSQLYSLIVTDIRNVQSLGARTKEAQNRLRFTRWVNF